MSVPSHDTCNKKKAFFTDIKDGYTYILQTKIILTLILVGISWGLIGGAYQLLLTIYAEKIFHTNIGILYTVQGAGLMIGSLLVNLYISHNKEKMKKAFGWAYFLQGIFFLGFILSNQLIFGIITLLCMRIAGGIIVPLDTTLLQAYTHENMIGKVFSFHYSIYGSLIQFSMFITGWLLEILSPQMIGSLLAICCIFVSFIWLFLFYSGEFNEESTSKLIACLCTCYFYLCRNIKEKDDLFSLRSNFLECTVNLDYKKGDAIMFDDRLTISAEQQKLISNATRIQILHLLKDEALTAKQVATKLNKSTGSVHYHVQILYDGGLLELVDTKEKRGIIEKYYKAKSAHFYIEESGTEGTNTGSHIVSHLFLTPEELQQLTWEVTQVLLRWENKTARQSNSEEEYAISCRIKKQ